MFFKNSSNENNRNDQRSFKKFEYDLAQDPDDEEISEQTEIYIIENNKIDNESFAIHFVP